MITALTTDKPAHERQGNVWDYVSPSRLGLWLRCPLAYKFRYVDGIKSPTTPSLFLGKRCHSALEIWYRHRQLGHERLTFPPSSSLRPALHFRTAVHSRSLNAFGSCSQTTNGKTTRTQLKPTFSASASSLSMKSASKQ